MNRVSAQKAILASRLHCSWITHGVYLLTFIVEQNMVGIYTAVMVLVLYSGHLGIHNIP